VDLRCAVYAALSTWGLVMSDPYQSPETPRATAPGSSLSTKQWLAILGAGITIAVLASVLTAVLVTSGGGGHGTQGTQPIALLAGSSGAAGNQSASGSGGVDATSAVNSSTPSGAGEVIVNTGKAGSTPTKSVTASAPTSHASSATSNHTSGASSGGVTTPRSFIRPSDIASLVSGIHIGPIITKLDYQASANYGEANLTNGFSPDPYSVGMTTGGPVDTSYLGSSCSGFATSHPDLKINFGGGGSHLLRIYFVASSGNPAIVINDPYGNFYCVNDSFGTVNPTIDFNNPAGGSYDVWVASSAVNTTISGTLYITENSGNHP
jgi:hypothetical protein